jgi:hypothetical protein
MVRALHLKRCQEDNLNNIELAVIDPVALQHVTGGGWKGRVAKWIGRKAGDVGAWVGLRAEEFGRLPIDKKVSTIAAASGALSAPVAAGAAVYNAVKK